MELEKDRLGWDDVHRSLNEYAIELFGRDVAFVVINKKYRYFALHSALLEDAGLGDLPRVSFDGLTPHEAAIAFVERMERLAEASAGMRKASAEKMASALRELEALA